MSKSRHDHVDFILAVTPDTRCSSRDHGITKAPLSIEVRATYPTEANYGSRKETYRHASAIVYRS